MLIVINVGEVGQFIICFLEENGGIFVSSNNETVVKTRYSMRLVDKDTVVVIKGV